MIIASSPMMSWRSCRDWREKGKRSRSLSLILRHSRGRIGARHFKSSGISKHCFWLRWKWPTGTEKSFSRPIARACRNAPSKSWRAFASRPPAGRGRFIKNLPSPTFHLAWEPPRSGLPCDKMRAEKRCRQNAGKPSRSTLNPLRDPGHANDHRGAKSK